MTLTTFLEKFLPDYSHRDDVAALDDLYRYVNYEMTDKEIKDNGLWGMPHSSAFDALIQLQDELFSETLRNFADKICDGQRVNCANEAETDIMYPFDMSSSSKVDKEHPYNQINMSSILNAKQPKIEEL